MQSNAETPDRTAGNPGRPHDRDNVVSVLGVGLTALLAALTLLLIAARIFPPRLAFSSLEGYLPFHIGMDIFAIVISMLVFAVGWNADSKNRTGNIVLLPCVFLAVGLLDFAHMLSFPGMPDFVTPGNPEKAINFWMAARGLAAFALLVAAVQPWQPFALRWTKYWVLVTTLGITGLVYWLVLFHQDTLPATFIPGAGLTPFKIGAEYALIALNGLAAAVFYFRLRARREDHLRSLFGASYVIILNGVFFTFFSDIADIYNQLGHVYKVIAYYLIYRAIFVHAVRQPYAELQQSQSDLRQSEERFRAIFDYAADGIGLLDSDGRYLRVNRKFSDILGYAEDELVGKTFQEITHPDDLVEDLNQSEQLRAGLINAFSLEKRYLRKDGSIIWTHVSSALLHGSAGAPNYSISSINDISDRKQAEEARAQLAAIVENATVAIFTRSLDGTILSWNAGAEKMLGYTAAETIGKPIALTLPPDRPANLARNNESLLRGDMVARESDRMTKDGRVIDVLTSHSPIKDGAENIVGASIILQDISALKQAEAKRAQLAAIVENSGDAIISRGLDRKILTWNAAAERLFGYTAAEVIGQPTSLLIPPEYEVQAAQKRASLNYDRPIPGYDSVRLTKDGRRIDVSIAQSPVNDSSGKLIGVSIAFRDISERKRVEAERAQLAAIVESSQNAIIGRKLEGTITSWNAGAERIFGYTKAEALGRHITMLIPPERRDVFEANQKLLRDGRGHPPFESIQLAKDGRRIPVSVSISPIRDAQGRVLGVSIIVHDITERKRAEAERAQLAAIVENSSDAIIGRALDGTITSWNAAAERLYGYTAAEAIGGELAQTVPPEQRHELVTNRKLISQGTLVPSYETVRVTKDGRRIDIAFSVSPLKDDSGNLIGMAAIVHDISERKRAAAQILKLNAELEQRVVERTRRLEAVNKELEAFSYSVSHDLRAPLRGIDGFSQMLLKKYAGHLDATGSDYLQRIRRASVRMGELIDDLLQLSRVSRSQIRTEPVDLSRLARSILAELQDREPERKVVTEVQDGIEVSADLRLLKIALENLLGNAWKFTGKNSEAKVRFEAKQQDGELIVSVKDNGAGFNPKYMHKLFGAFQRLHNATEFEGTGIGLATVQRIIHLHGGRVWADATVDKGATFYFAMPRATRNDITTTPQGEAA